MADVVLVSMPFGPVFAPSLGLSLLKAGLARRGVDASVHYFTIKFAESIGRRVYSGIADGFKPVLEDLPGEWLFSAPLFDATPADDEQYVRERLNDYYSASLISRLRHVRATVDTFLDDCLRIIVREQPRIVGFTSMFQQHTASLALARRLKLARPNTFIVLGGANCEGVMGAETIRSFPFVDAVVSGEADVIFPELVERVLSGKAVLQMPGVRSRELLNLEFATGSFANAPAVSTMDDLPYPDFSDYFAQFGASRYERDWQVRIFMETARGCWWGERMHCTFCGLNGATMRFRSKSAERTLTEIADLSKRHPGCDIQIVDNILDLRYFKDVIPALAARRERAVSFWETKSNLNKTQVRLLRDAGIREIQPGIESLSDDVLKLMRKGVTALQNIQLLKWCTELGIDADWNFLWGFPGEQPDEYKRLAHIIPLLTHLKPPGAFNTIRMDRFSPNFFDAERLGFSDVRPFSAYRHIYRLPDSAITNLACYFEYGYREPRDVARYVRPLERQLAKWQRVKDRTALLAFEAGQHLVLLDLRAVRRDPFVVLDGLPRRLYIQCDSVCDASQLARGDGGEGGESATRVEEVLGLLVERGLLLRQGSRYLSLAVSAEVYRPSSWIAREFSSLVRTIGMPSGNKWIVPAILIRAQDDAAGSSPTTWPRSRKHDRRNVPVPRLASCEFSVDARGRLVIQTSERPRQGRRT